MSASEVFQIAGAVILSTGGATAIIFGLSTWLGRLFSMRIMQAELAKHEKSLEQLKATLRKDTEAELENLRHYQKAEMDILLRRRQIYEKVIVAMRVFLSSPQKSTIGDKQSFLASYDLCHLWASDAVLASLGTFLDLMIKQTAAPGSIEQSDLRKAYTDSITEIRKDAGFLETNVTPESYRIVSFI